MHAHFSTDVRSLRDARSLLGLHGPVDAEILARAFRTAIKAARPDQPGGDAERYRRIIVAYRLIQKAHPARPALAAPVSRAAAPPVVAITPMQALAGARVTVGLGERTLRIAVPAGVRSAEHVRLKGCGDAGGDLYLPVLIRAADGLSAVGDHLHMSWPVSPRLLNDGGRVVIETYVGERSAWVTPGLAAPVRLRLRGLGLPERSGRRQGHLFVTLEAAATAVTPAEDRLARFTALWTPERMAA